MEQERGLCQDRRLFRHPTRESALTCEANQKGRSQATGPSPENLRIYFAIPASCMALLRCMPQAPILPLSIESCAIATSFWAMNLPSPSAMVSIMDSVLVRFGPLQPAAVWAALAGTTA